MPTGRTSKRRRISIMAPIPTKEQESLSKSDEANTAESRPGYESAEGRLLPADEDEHLNEGEKEASTKAHSKCIPTVLPKAASSESGTLPEKHLLFKEWAISQGVVIHPSVTPAALPGRGIGLQTIKSIPQKTRILFIPEKAIFKPRGEDAKSRPNLSPHAHLALSAFNCFPRDPDLGVWVDTWPTDLEIFNSLPLFWNQAMRDQLPLSTKAILDRQELDFKTDKASANAKDPSFEYYWAIVNSRSFHWKPAGGGNGYMVLCPFIDYLNHGPQGTGMDVHQTSKGFEVWTEKAYAPNEELLFTYGAHSNDKLLVHYGFLHSPPSRDSPSDDSLNLDHIILPKFSDSVKSTLQHTGFLGNYAYIPQEAELCFRTQVAIRAQLFSANEWEYFCLNGEDMGVNRSEEVEEWLKKPLGEFLEETRVRLRQCEERKGLKEEDEVPQQVIRERWRHIEAGLFQALKVDFC